MKTSQRPHILRTSAAALLALVVFSPLPLQATVITWTGAVDNNWETNTGVGPTNWTPNTLTPFSTLDDAELVFTGSLKTTTFNDNAAVGNPTELQSLTFDSKAAGFSLTGNQIQLAGGAFIINNSPNLQVIGFSGGTNGSPGTGGIRLFNISFNNAGAIIPYFYFTAAAGDILITSTVSFQTNGTLVVGGSHNITITGSIFEVPAATGSLVKNGTGKLLLGGQNTYTGDTTVNGGVLDVEGSIASPHTFVNAGGALVANGLVGSLQTFVNNGGALSGHGVIGGDLYSSGNVSPGNSPGTLTVKGSYFQSNGGTLTVEIAGKSAGQYDVLAVQKTATVAGNLRIVQVGSAPRLNVGEKITFLTATQGVKGRFSNVSSSIQSAGTIVADQIVYGPNSVSLEGMQGSFAALKDLTPNQYSVAKVLDRVAFHNQQPKLIGYLNNEPLGNLPGDFDRIAPEELTSIFTIGTALANVQTTNLQRRTDDLRSGSRGFSAAGFATAGSGPLYSGNAGVAGPSGNDGKDSKEMKAVAPPEDRWGVFITGVGEWVGVGDDFNARGYDITTGGFTLGADYKVTPNFAIGLDAGYAGTTADLNNGGRVSVNGGKLGLYATYFTGGFYVDTAVGGGYNSYDTHRAGLQGTAHGSTDGGELNVLFGTGYDWKMGGFSIGPTATFQYTYLGISDFSETGSLAPLRFPSQNQDSVRTAFGMKASYDWKVGGVIVKPELRAAWQHEYGDDSYTLNSSLEGAGGTPFNVNGPVTGRDSLLLGAGFAIMWNERTSTYVYYDGELGRTRYDSQNVSGGVRVSF